MSQFWQDILKIVIDKALLGSIALALGFYLARKLEDHRSRRSRELSVVGRHLDAVRDVLALVSSQHTQLLKLADVIRVRLEKRAPLSEEQMEPANQFEREYDAFASKLKALTPFLLADIIVSLNSYLDSFVKVRGILTEQDAATMPSNSELDSAFARFAIACAKSIETLRDSA